MIHAVRRRSGKTIDQNFATLVINHVLDGRNINPASHAHPSRNQANLQDRMANPPGKPVTLQSKTAGHEFDSARSVNSSG
ncbi:MAG TPA: hypothetical protein VFA63_10310 [Pseudonocardiaceae bacterium]|nr:hypothetical protein [Pseudonocardiaceae bacterium]